MSGRTRRSGLTGLIVAGSLLAQLAQAQSPGGAAGAPPQAVEITDAILAQNASRPVPARIPTSVFATPADFRNIVLSPSGQRFAARITIEGKEYIRIRRLDGADQPWTFQIPAKMDFNYYRWAGDDRLLVSVGQMVPWDDDEARATRLVIADLTTHKLQVVGKGYEMGLRGDDLLWTDPEGKTALVAFQPSIYDYPAVFSVDLATNRASKVVGSMPSVWNWYADTAGVVRYGYGWVDAHHWQMVYRKDPTERFKVVARGTDKDDDAAKFARDKTFTFAAGTDEGFILDTAADTGRSAIYRYNFATHQRGEMVFAAPGADVDWASTTEDGKSVFVATFTDSRDRVRWFDPAMAELQAALDKAISGTLGDREVWITSRNRDNTVMVVHVMASNDPGRYFIWQAASPTLAPLTKRNPGLKPADLAVSRYVHYTARDGTVIPAYLTLPPGRPAKGLPLIILPHGGPYFVRDHGDYDSDVQFLANRGYVVLQPQFRGSESYGKSFEEAGHAQWGRAMQDDLDDGMDWLVKRGIVDAKRTCLVGSSYGGYAALWGATRNPERYRCAVSFAGISDMPRSLKYQMNSMGDKQEREEWRQQVQGDPTVDLRAFSPLFSIDRLKVPVMLLHGTDDQTVQPKQSRLYADALKAAGKSYEYYEIANEGHGFSSQESAQLWYDKLDAFLAAHNPAQ
ncbi:alpha/beta hydrolase family protein [Novosphingobium aerophilum]|uniref:S9 family peptidase n=1 Tax=Novosphingobium aerophilum TaxID=2839843 RepID=A0A7X1F6M0_9SPHN|nr:alpha/beta fold hydrolase [Novosphingobium aerophilum]MBC2651370.1 S9 family peptidase [Novosphingobium aerophilum]